MLLLMNILREWLIGIGRRTVFKRRAFESSSLSSRTIIGDGGSLHLKRFGGCDQS